MAEDGSRPELLGALFADATPLMRRILELLAAQPDQEVSAEAIASQLGVGRQAVAGAMGAYSGLIYRRYRRREGLFSVRRDYVGDQTYYRMSGDVADIVKTLVRSRS